MTDYNFRPKRTRDEYGWYSRRLPHFDGPQRTQFVTFRLADSMPSDVLERWRGECRTDADLRRRVEKFLDAGHGECWLRQPAIGEVVMNAFLFHDGTKYDLHSWVIMPNHAHVLLSPFQDQHLPEILHSLKSYTAQQANKILNRKGQFWQHESFDRYIRNSRHYWAVVKYIENNPVKAGLCTRPEDWRLNSSCLVDDG